MTKPPKSGKGNKGGKKKYTAPKIVRHGNLETVAERITGTVAASCCVTERIRASRRSPQARASLMADVSRIAVLAAASR